MEKKNNPSIGSSLNSWIEEESVSKDFKALLEAEKVD